MDNLTHSLVGALIGQMGLKRKTGLAMPTLIIAANIPDIDALATLLGGHQHLAIRRGITHGPIAMLLLPLLLWAAMFWFDRWQARRGTRPEKRLPVDAKWLLGLAYIGCLSHPLFDWFNSYGIRLLEPFSSQWFYGDTLFIIDVWIWIALILSVSVSLLRERREVSNWRQPALMGFATICAYVFANGLITERAERSAKDELRVFGGYDGPLVVANAVPFKFWEREILWRTERQYGEGNFTLFPSSKAEVNPSSPGNPVYLERIVRSHLASKIETLSKSHPNPSVRAYLFWSRMPVAEVSGEGDERKLVISDQRFGNELVRERFTVSIPWKGNKE